MSKTTFTAANAKKLIAQIWKGNDYPIDVIWDGVTERHFDSVVEFLNVKFYTYAASRGSGIYALVEAVKPDNGLLVPKADYAIKSYKITFALPATKADVLESFIQNLRAKHFGVLQDLSASGKNVKGYLAFDVLTYDQQPNPKNIDLPIVCSVDLQITYSSNVALAGQKIWKLDGVELPYIQEGVDLEKNGNTNDVFGDKSSQTLPTKQTKYFRFTLPFVSNNTALIALQKEILDGDMTQEHTLTYHDSGLTFSESEPFTVRVTLFRTARSSAQVASKSDFDVVFIQADDQKKSKVQYRMALVDNHFDAGSQNTRWFSNQLEQQAWFAQKVATSPAKYVPIKAPNIGSLIISSQVYFAPSGVDLAALLSKNYAIIEATEGESIQYYYYYVTNANVGGDNQIIVSLQLDSIQTYYFNQDLEIAPCVINRAHLNRWVDNSDGTVSFNNGPDSPLLNYEGLDLPKRLVGRERLDFKIDTGTSPMNDFFIKHRVIWALLFFAKNNAVRAVLNNQNHKEVGDLDYPFTVSGFDTGLYCVVAPVYDDDYGQGEGIYIKSYLKSQGGEDCKWQFSSTYSFFAEHGLLAHLQSVKLTPICPLEVGDYSQSCHIKTVSDNNHLLIDNLGQKGGGLAVGTLSGNAIFMLLRQTEHPSVIEIDLPINRFSKESIKSDYSQLAFNPKLLSKSILEFSIVDYMGNSYIYDVQKLNASKVKILANELQCPDLTKGYIRIKDSQNSIYSNKCDENYTGLVYSNDATIPYVLQKLDEFLANNKNFALMQQAGRDYDRENTKITNITSAIKGGIGTATNLASQNYTGAANGILDTGLGIASSKISLGMRERHSKLIENLTLDNMRNGPSSLKNAQGNILFSCLANNNGFPAIYYELYDAIEQDKQKFNDYCNLFGFSFDRIGSVKYYDHIRHFYNYVQAEIDTLKGISLSMEARNDIRNRFAGGVRFWKVDEVDYQKENYEEALIEGGLPPAPIPTQYNVSIGINGQGDVTPKGQVVVNEGDDIVITASTKNGSNFKWFWVEHEQHGYADNPFTIRVNRNMTITAIFTGGSIEV